MASAHASATSTRAAALSAAPTQPAKPTARVQAPSVYDLPVALRDDSGAVRPLEAFRGHPVLVTMFYGSCPVACPLLTSDLKRLERQIPEPMRSDVRILMVSFDSTRDTPAALAQIKQERGLDATRWTLASADDDDARGLAGVLGVKYRKLDNGAFFHSSVIVLLDREGRPQARIEGADRDVTALLTTLTAPSI